MATLWKRGGLTWHALGRRVWDELREDAILGHAAQLAFYFLLSLLPLLLVLLALLGYALGTGPTLRTALIQYLSAVAPASASGFIATTLQEIATGVSVGQLALGLVTTLWAASSGMVAISNALNSVYDVKETRPWWHARLVAVALMLVLLLLMVTSLMLITYGGDIAAALAARIGLGDVFPMVWHIVQWLLVLAFVVLAFNLVYLYAPNLKHWAWHWLMPGTVAGVLVWLLGSGALKLYLSFWNTYRTTYGSLGTVIILLLWFYLTGIAILIGGEVNAEIEKALGKAQEARHT